MNVLRCECLHDWNVYDLKKGDTFDVSISDKGLITVYHHNGTTLSCGVEMFFRMFKIVK